jgi:hypothetical protein
MDVFAVPLAAGVATMSTALIPITINELTAHVFQVNL